MNPFRHLVVCLANSAADSELIEWAASLCRFSAPQSVHFVHVLPQPFGSDSPSYDVLKANLTQRITISFNGVHPSVQIGCDVLSGPLTDRILAYVAEHQIDLVVVGHRRESSRHGALGRRLAMKAPCSVSVVPEGSPAIVSRILVPIDFSEPAEDTLQVAIALARLSGAVCIPLHVYFNSAVITYEEYDEVLRGQEEKAYQKFVAPIDCQGVELKPLFEEGPNVAQTIDRIAKREAADLIMMGTRGRSRSAAILLGSVTEETIVHSRVPVLAVKHFGARMNVLQALLDRRFLYEGGIHTD